MLTICTDNLPQNLLSYLAFRLAAVETVKLHEYAQHPQTHLREPYGFLTEVPFFREVPAQVQLSALAETWAKHISERTFQANLVDEAVLYAACETAARIAEYVPELIRSFTEEGPLDAGIVADHFLVSELRNLHLNLSNEGDFLLVTQFQDLPPEERDRCHREYHLGESYLEPMFDLLGQWHPEPDMLTNLSGLFTDAEIAKLRTQLQMPERRPSVSKP